MSSSLVGAQLAVLKLNPEREITWRYEGRVIAAGEKHVVLEAFFDREDSCVEGMLITTGDRFVETYYADRWYNVFEIYARADGSLRGWYCNVGLPATWDQSQLSYVDLALDLLVFPDGRQVVMDEDEFAALDIPEAWRHKAWSALAELQALYPLKQA
jgi:uncharacterized protein